MVFDLCSQGNMILSTFSLDGLLPVDNPQIENDVSPVNIVSLI
jgi:hypothetical protein